MILFDPLHIFRKIIESDPSYIDSKSSIYSHPCDVRKRICDDDEKLLYSEAQIQKRSKYEDAKVSAHIVIDMSFFESAYEVSDSFFHK